MENGQKAGEVRPLPGNVQQFTFLVSNTNDQGPSDTREAKATGIECNVVLWEDDVSAESLEVDCCVILQEVFGMQSCDAN
jgi:hypothetical protein